MIETRAAGKLFIVGEYAVVEAGEPAVLVAVDRFLRVRLTERATANETSSDPVSTHVRSAINAVDELRRERGLPERFFDIETASELDDTDGRKFGLGSSGAVTVATVEALDQLYRLHLSPVERFRVALLATIELSPQSSGGDLAASTFGGWVRYCSPNRDVLRAHRAAHGITSAMRDEHWIGCEVQQLSAPAELELLVGWTGSPASTETLVGRAADGQRTPDQHFLAASRAAVEAFCAACAAGAGGGEVAMAAIRDARALLKRFSEDRGMVVETEALSALCAVAEQHGAAAKSSGAGGGDCGIALATPDSDIAGILREWEQQGITPLALKVHTRSSGAEGATNER